MRNFFFFFCFGVLIFSQCKPPSEKTVLGKWKLIETRIKSPKKVIPASQKKGTVEAIFSTDGKFTTTFKGQRINFFSYTYQNNQLIINNVVTAHYFNGDTLFLVTDKNRGITDVYLPVTLP